MSSKKSYMDSNQTIINEGVLGVLTGLIAGGHFIKFLKYLKRFSPKLKGDINTLNKQIGKIEKNFEKEFGKKVKFDRFKISDFIRTAK